MDSQGPTLRDINRVARALHLGLSKAEVRTMLQEDRPMSEYDIFLTYCAGLLVCRSWGTPDPSPTLPSIKIQEPT
jgi:hypothetical protein